MKCNSIILFLFLITTNVSGQDNVILKHKAYTTTFSKSKMYPIVVEYWVTKSMFGCKSKSKRTDKFVSDPDLKKYTNLNNFYKNSGYDRGHIFPALYAECDPIVMHQSFYYSNIIPQSPQLNRGDWKTVEELVKLESLQYDSIYVWAGGVGETKKLGSMSIPTKCWKVIWVKRTKEYFCFIFNNDFSLSSGIDDNKVLLKEVRKLTGLKFKK